MKYLLIISVLLSQFVSFAQNHIDLANVYWRYSPANAIEGYNLERDFSMYVMDFKLPVVLNDDNVFITGIEYQHNITTTRETGINPIIKPRDYEFASSTLQLGLEHKWNTKSKMLFMAFGRLNTNYKNISTDHFQLGGLALGTTSRSDKFDWKYGLYYNGEFFGPMLVPLFGFNWAINDKWRLKTVLPINLELSYRATERFTAGLRFDGVNGSYRGESSLDPLSSIANNEYLDKADNNVWLYSEFNLGKNVWFHVKAGHSVLRKYRFYDNNEKLALKLGPVNIGDDRPEAINQIENGFSFECRFIYRLPLD
jgi:hypothetical protein